MNKTTLFIGSYTNELNLGDGSRFCGKGKGIYICTFDCSNAVFEDVGVIEDIENPSFLACSADLKYLYAVSELHGSGNMNTGFVRAYQINRENPGGLFPAQQVYTGEDPCHITVDGDRHLLFIANYSGGSLSVVSLHEDGGIQGLSGHIAFSGKGKDPARQEMSHIHSTFLSKEESLLWAVDLGADRITAFQVCDEAPFLCQKNQYHGDPGKGPRMMVPAGQANAYYVVNELDSTVSLIISSAGTEKCVQSIPTTRDSHNNLASHIKRSADGRYLYIANRGADTISTFEIMADGRLCAVAQIPCGAYPRHFDITPDNRFLICANQLGDNLVAFEIDSGSGSLHKVSEHYSPSPTCVLPVVF